jgi:hypothetical protein
MWKTLKTKASNLWNSVTDKFHRWFTETITDREAFVLMVLIAVLVLAGVVANLIKMH